MTGREHLGVVRCARWKKGTYGRGLVGGGFFAETWKPRERSLRGFRPEDDLFTIETRREGGLLDEP